MAHTASFVDHFNRMDLLEAATIALQELILTLEAISISSSASPTPAPQSHSLCVGTTAASTTLLSSPTPYYPLPRIPSAHFA